MTPVHYQAHSSLYILQLGRNSPLRSIFGRAYPCLGDLTSTLHWGRGLGSSEDVKMMLLAGTTVAVSPSHSHMSSLADIPSPIVSELCQGIQHKLQPGLQHRMMVAHNPF